MTLTEFSRLSLVISSVYSMTFDDAKIEIWHRLLEDLDFEIAKKAVTKLAQTYSGVLTPAHIREVCAELISPQINDLDAIGLVNKAVRNFGRPRQIEAMEWLKSEDETVYQIVSTIGFANICNGNIDFLRPEITRLHRAAAKEIKTDCMLSNKTKSELTQIRNKLHQQGLGLLSSDTY